MRWTAWLLRIGVVAVAIVALPYPVFELDRFFVPKELVLHAVAALIALTLLLRKPFPSPGGVDALLGLFFAWSVASALLATNHWLAQRALAVTASSLVLFWAARRIGASGGHRGLVAGAALATVAAAASGLAQAYGVESSWFSLNRAPGGTFGNRNFVAHFTAIGLPALIYTVVVTRNRIGALLAGAGAFAVVAMLVLTRSRAAWLAVAASLGVALVALIAARSYWRGSGTGARLIALAGVSAAGVVAALTIPNSLNWRSDSPYLESALGIVDYSSGSGRGRVAQYTNSLKLALANPIVGVGPGNWPVSYVRFAPSGDESIASDGMTANPWPSSDWVAFVSERGAVAALALAAALALLFVKSFRRWDELPDGHVVLSRITLAATITATVVVSAFDAVLLLAAPAFLAWMVIGATSGAGAVAPEGGRRSWWYLLVIPALAFVLAGAGRSVTQLVAIAMVGSGEARAGWLSATALDPGSYRIALRAAQLEASRGRCAAARAHATRARELFPHAAAPRQVLRRCG